MLRQGKQLTRIALNSREIDIVCRQKYSPNRCITRLFANGKKGPYGPYKPPGTSKPFDSKGPEGTTKTDQRIPSQTKSSFSQVNRSAKISEPKAAPVTEGAASSGSGPTASSGADRHEKDGSSGNSGNSSNQNSSNNKLIFGGIALLAVGAGALYWLDVFGDGSSKKKLTSSEETKEKEKDRTERIPAKSADIPCKVQYLLIGGGTASFAAFRAIKSTDAEAKVLIVSREPHYPYMRPPLSKEMLYSINSDPGKELKFTQWNGVERSVYFEPPEFYAECEKFEELPHGGVAVARGWTVKKIDVSQKKAYLDDGYVISYDKCLVATGASPKKLPIFEAAPPKIQDKIMTYRGIRDFERIIKDIKEGAKSIAIIGGSFLGSELACALVQHGKQHKLEVSQIFRESGNMGKLFPEYLSKWTTDKVRNEGVHIYNNCEVKGLSLDKNKVVLSLNTGKEVIADKVIMAVGVEPNTDLAKTSGLEVDDRQGGFIVNSELMARSDLWVAGDCSCFYDEQLGRRRVEHHDHAVVSGRLAGENMTGAGKSYYHQSMFWSDLGPEIGFEAIGIIDSSLPTVSVFAKSSESDTPKAVVSETNEGDRSKTEENPVTVPSVDNTNSENPKSKEDNVKISEEDYGKGVIFYLRNEEIVGILLWNVFNRMAIARQVLREGKKFSDLNEVAKLFNIHGGP